ncbi:MAG: hypothetical protein QM581_08775 [Pseudomonas sp.]
MKKILGLLLVLAASLVLPASAAGLGGQGAAKFNGAWKSVHETSSWSDGKFPANFSLTINLHFQGDTLHYRSVNDSNKDAPRVLEFTANFDGKPYPIAGSERYNQVALKRLRDDTFELLQLKDGDVIVGAVWQLLPDGQLVRWGVGKSPEGRSRAYIEYFKK